MSPSEALSIALGLFAVHGADTARVVRAYIERLRQELGDDQIIQSWVLVNEAAQKLVQMKPLER